LISNQKESLIFETEEENSQSESQMSKIRGHVEVDLTLQKYGTSEDCLSKKKKNPEVNLNLSHPKQQDTSLMG
jgi:hypothetical protein